MQIGAAPISLREGTDNIDYILDGKILLSKSKTSIPVADPYLVTFLRFFLHRYGGHPSIVNTNLFLEGIPTRISITHAGEVRKTLTVKSVVEGDSTHYSLTGLSQRHDVNATLRKLAGRLSGKSRSARVAKENELLVMAHHALT